jgi:RNA polymerase sigma-70 factor (ECF subfamily)
VSGSKTSPDNGPGEEFIQLFTRSQRRLYLLILAQVGNVDRAEEILQESNVVLLSKHRQFQAGTNFFAWAAQIAHYEVLKSRQRRKRDRLRFQDEEFLQVVAAEVATQTDALDDRRHALQQCLGRLRVQDRELINRRYAPGASGKLEAEALGRPANSLYQSIGRIRRMLLECIRRRLAGEALA